jgi:hypothetical protein
MFDVPLVTVLMGADPFDVEEGLDELAELGLLEFIGQRRYRLHDLLRLFSWHELRREDEQFGERAQARLRSWLLSTAALAGRMFGPDEEESRLDLPESLTDRAAADQWLRWNREQWWPAFQHAARLARDREVIEVAEALHWYAPTWMAWNSWQALFSLSVEAARRTGDKRLESTQLGHLAWADLTEQKDARAALERAREALLAAQEVRLGIGELLLDMNQPAEALGEAANVREEARAASLSAEIGRAHMVAARAARALGDEDLADSHIKAGLAQLDRGADATAGQVRDQLQALQR